MIKKTTLALTFTVLTATTSLAQTDTLMYTKPGGLTDRLLTIVEDSLGSEHGKRVSVDSCAAAATYLNSTDTPTIAMWGPEFQFPKEDGSPNPCALSDDKFVGFYAAAPYLICYKDGNSQAENMSFLREADISVGAYYSAYNFVPLSSVMQALNPNAKVIPYKSSKNYRPALQAGEIDYTMPTSVKDGEKCIATLGEQSVDGLPTVKSMIDHPFNILTYSYTVVGANIDNIDSFVSDVHASDAWKNRKDQKYTPFLSDLSRAEQLDWQITINDNIAASMAKVN